MAMTPGQVNFLCPQGSTFSKQITYKISNPEFDSSQPSSESNPEDIPVDLTGYSARMQVRQNYYSEDTVVNLSTGGNGIFLGGSEGTIDIFIDNNTTANFPAGSWLYDLEVESSSGIVGRLIEGSFIVTPEVTR
jgi:hypothetical protein